MRTYIIALVAALAGCTESASTLSSYLDDNPIDATQAACFDRVKADAIAQDWSNEAYEAALQEQCGAFEAGANACADEVKAEAIAAQENGVEYDYAGQLATRCQIIITGSTGAGGDTSGSGGGAPDPATTACANEVKAEALAAQEAGEPYDYEGTLYERCGIAP